MRPRGRGRVREKWAQEKDGVRKKTSGEREKWNACQSTQESHQSTVLRRARTHTQTV